MSGYGYPTDQSGYYSGSNYMMPQYTQAQLSAYYHQYGQYPPGYQPQTQVQPQQTQAYGVATPPYGQPTAIAYGQPQATSTPGYDHSGYLANAQMAPRPRSPRTWKCELSNCTSTANFTRLADLQRHQATVHGVGTPDFPCTVKDCSRVGDKGFTRRDHLVEHLRNFHHIDIPKRKPGERSAYPLGLPNYQ